MAKRNKKGEESGLVKSVPAVVVHLPRLMAVEDLKRYDRNPKRWPKKNRERLQASLERFGLVQNFILNNRTGMLVDGNGRSVAVSDLGVTHVPVAEVDISADEENALRLTLLSKGVRGVVTDRVRPLVEEAQLVLPDLCMALGLSEVQDQVEEDVEEKRKVEFEADKKPGRKGKLVVKQMPQKDVDLVEERLDEIAALNKVEGKGARAYAMKRVFTDLEPKKYGPDGQERGD